MSVPVTVSIANPDPETAPTNFVEFVAELNALIEGTVDAEFDAFIVGAATPGVDDQDKVWFKLDGAGRPLGPFLYYGGNWRRADIGRASEVRMYKGDPASHFDGTGKGLVNTDWDGWALMNGNNGTANISDKFIVAAHMDNAGAVNGYLAGWRSTVAGAAAATGGAASITLTDDNTYQRATPEIKMWKWSADGNAGRNGGNLYGTSSVPGVTQTFQDADAGNTEPDAIAIIPPFYALAYAAWVGYD